MKNYSVTQASNIAAFSGLVVLILGHFKIIVTQEEIAVLLGALLSAGGTLYNFYHRHSKGDLTLFGARK